MKSGKNNHYIFLLVLVLVGAVFVSNIYGFGGKVLERLEADCENCNKKTNATNLSAMNSIVNSIKSDLDGVKGEVEANKAIIDVQGGEIKKNSTFVDQVQAQIKKLETEITKAED